MFTNFNTRLNQIQSRYIYIYISRLCFCRYSGQIHNSETTPQWSFPTCYGRSMGSSPSVRVHRLWETVPFTFSSRHQFRVTEYYGKITFYIYIHFDRFTMQFNGLIYRNGNTQMANSISSLRADLQICFYWPLILLRLSEKLSRRVCYYYANVGDIIVDASVPKLA